MGAKFDNATGQYVYLSDDYSTQCSSPLSFKYKSIDDEYRAPNTSSLFDEAFCLEYLKRSDTNVDNNTIKSGEAKITSEDSAKQKKIKTPLKEQLNIEGGLTRADTNEEDQSPSQT